MAIGASTDMEDAAMSRANKTSKQKRRGKTLPPLGAAGLSLALTSGAHAATAGTSVDKPTLNTLLSQEITLTKEEISDVSLSTFYVFDKENAHLGQQLAWGCRCGGCRCGCAFRACRCGCGGCGCAFRACRCGGCGCAFRACRCGCGGCG